MPRYTSSPHEDSASSFVVFPDGLYIFEIIKATSFQNEKPNAKNQVGHGVRYQLKNVTDGEYKDKKSSFNAMQHTEGSKGMAKSFLMAAYGLDPNVKEDEKKFDEISLGLQWGYNTDDGSVDEGWAKAVGNQFAAEVGQQPSKDEAGNVVPDRYNQTWKRFIPLGKFLETLAK